MEVPINPLEDVVDKVKRSDSRTGLENDAVILLDLVQSILSNNFRNCEQSGDISSSREIGENNE